MLVCGSELTCMRLRLLLACLALLACWMPALAADVTVREMSERLFRADPTHPIDFSRLNLRELDLSGLDFKRAKLAGSDLFGADLSAANLSGADLSGAHLDRI